jgi:hypothetical protein
MQPVFARLNCSSTKDILNELWEERLIALHYGDSFSLNPDDYPNAGKHALARLQRYARDGAIVAANFHRLHRDRLLLGELQPGSEVRAKKFGDRYVYKVAKLTHCREVKYADFPLLLAIQPRQGTLVGWPSAKDILRSALHGEPLPIKVSSLSPDQLEVVCYEYLRTSERISRLLMPIGRCLIDIDIFGIDKHGRRVLAQVTQACSAKANAEKMNNLLAHRDRESQLYFFGILENAKENPAVTVFDVGDVFKASLDDTESRFMVLRMLGLPAETATSEKNKVVERL